MKRILFTLALALILSSCAGGDPVKEQKQIAASCATINVLGNAIAANAETAPADKKAKAKALAAKALVIARPTTDWCEPKPVVHLSPADYAALLMAATDMATLKKESAP
jgi:hypothetical protein